MFSLKNIEYQYAGNAALHLPDWSGTQGSQHLILGASGSGKTTLLHLMAGLLRPQQGDIWVAERQLKTLKAAELKQFRGQHVALVPQKLHLIHALNVFDNLRLAQYYAGVATDTQRIDTLLAQLALTPYKQRYPRQLSQGQAQRVAIARAVLNQPRVLLADEPTANLDDAHCQQVIELLINQAQQCQATLVVASHDARLKPHLPEQLTLGLATATAASTDSTHSTQSAGQHG